MALTIIIRYPLSYVCRCAITEVALSVNSNANIKLPSTLKEGIIRKDLQEEEHSRHIEADCPLK